jgi:hypothetical protein
MGGYRSSPLEGTRVWPQGGPGVRARYDHHEGHGGDRGEADAVEAVTWIKLGEVKGDEGDFCIGNPLEQAMDGMAKLHG